MKHLKIFEFHNDTLLDTVNQLFNSDYKTYKFIGEGEYSETYSLDDSEYCMNVREYDWTINSYRKMVGIELENIVNILQVETDENKTYILMDKLFKLNVGEEDAIDAIDDLFHVNGRDAIDSYLQTNLDEDFTGYIKYMLDNTTLEDYKSEYPIEDAIQHYKSIKRIKKHFNKYYEDMFNQIVEGFRQYNNLTGMDYIDFHSANLMKDKHGTYKLIDLFT